MAGFADMARSALANLFEGLSQTELRKWRIARLGVGRDFKGLPVQVGIVVDAHQCLAPRRNRLLARSTRFGNLLRQPASAQGLTVASPSLNSLKQLPRLARECGGQGLDVVRTASRISNRVQVGLFCQHALHAERQVVVESKGLDRQRL